MRGNQHLSTHTVRPVVKLTIPQRNVTLEQTQLVDHLDGKNDQKGRMGSNKETLKTVQM